MSVRSSAKHYHLEHVVVVLLVSLAAAWMVHTNSFLGLSRSLNDTMTLSFSPPDDSNVLMVTIDSDALSASGSWPWDRRVHAELVEKLYAAGARKVALDLIFAQPDRFRPDSDTAFARALRRAGNVYLPVHVTEQQGGRMVERMPHPALARAALGLGHVDLSVDEDGRVRGFYLRTGVGEAWWPHLAMVMLGDEQPELLAEFPLLDGDPRPGTITVQQHYRMLSFQGIDRIPRMSASELLRTDSGTDSENAAENDPVEKRRQRIEGKVVFVGVTADALGDRIPLPGGQAAPGVAVNAHVYTAVRSGQLITPLSTSATLLVTLVLALLVPLFLPFMMPGRALLLVMTVLLLVLLVAFVLLRVYTLWFPAGPALVAAVLAYPLWTWRRLEYSLRHLRKALDRAPETSGLDRRLLMGSSVDDMLAMVEQFLPVQSWRLERLPGELLLEGGKPQSSRGWQGTRARHYSFTVARQSYELILVWEEEQYHLSLEHWVQAMLRRCQGVPSKIPTGYSAMDSPIEQVADRDRRQLALSRFFEASLAGLSEGILVVDACGQVLFVNERVRYWLDERRPVSVLPMSRLLEKIRLNDRRENWRDVIREALIEGRCQRECHIPQGQEFYLDVLRTRAGEFPGEILIITFKDIGEVKHALHTKGEVLDFLSHDLRSPMLSVLAICEKHRQQESTDQDWQDLFSSIEDYTRRSLHIADQFLMLARAEGLEPGSLVAIDMLAVCESAVQEITQYARHADIRLNFEYDDTDDVWVVGSHALLQRALYNLLHNAISYSPAGGQVSLVLQVSNKQVVCTVRDQGLGMTPELQQQLLDPDPAVPVARTPGTGPGLGLRFVKVVVARHSGTLSLESKPDHGAAFTLSLPLVEVDSLL